MSADNGVYIARFPDGYRVAHAQAIENVDYFKPGTLERKIVLRRYFGKSKLYSSQNSAILEAHKVALEVTKDGDPLEYGVAIIGEYEEFQSSGIQEQCWRCDKIFIPKKGDDTSSCKDCIGHHTRINYANQT